MGGFFGAVSQRDVTLDIFFGVDYHSHLGTRRGGMIMFDEKDGFQRQIHNIEMIASESTVPLEVLELNGSVFTNKSLEGYPGGRYQAGSEFADQMETLACQRAKELYGAEHVNMQTYSGTTANYSVYASV